MTALERDALAPGAQPAIRNVARFIADYYVALPALRAEFKQQIPSDAALERSFRDFSSLWLRSVHVRVTEASSGARSDAELYRPLLELLGFDERPRRQEIELDPERVVLGAYGTDDRIDLLIDALPFGLSPDDRLERGEFRGSAQRRMVRALPRVARASARSSAAGAFGWFNSIPRTSRVISSSISARPSNATMSRPSAVKSQICCKFRFVDLAEVKRP